MIEIKNLKKKFQTPRGTITVFEDFSLEIPDKIFLGISGKSGSGKSTLLSIIAGLQKADDGKIIVNGTDIFSLDDKKLSAFRNQNIGFISQEQSFLENLTVIDNVRLPYFLNPAEKKHENLSEQRAQQLLDDLGIGKLAKSFPRELSGGENHRVLIARALMNNPDFILADEPTESVDEEQTNQIMKIFRSLSDSGKTVILVSHDSQALKSCDRIISII